MLVDRQQNTTMLGLADVGCFWLFVVVLSADVSSSSQDMSGLLDLDSIGFLVSML